MIFGVFLRDMAKNSLFCGWKEKRNFFEEGGWNSAGTFFGLKVRVWLLMEWTSIVYCEINLGCVPFGRLDNRFLILKAIKGLHMPFGKCKSRISELVNPCWI